MSRVRILRSLCSSLEAMTTLVGDSLAPAFGLSPKRWQSLQTFICAPSIQVERVSGTSLPQSSQIMPIVVLNSASLDNSCEMYLGSEGAIPQALLARTYYYPN